MKITTMNKAQALQKAIDEHLTETEPSLRADILGMAFYYQTRIWPLFKSAPIGMVQHVSDEDRQKMFQIWYDSPEGNIFTDKLGVDEETK